jgi:gamma-glutamyltranspeptidase/glutathione hydrolase
VSRRLLCVLAVAIAFAAPVAASAEPYRHVTQPVATGSGGAVTTVDGVATSAGISALRHGGNAVDAAVTAAAVLGVTEPFSCGIGGGGFMVIRTPDGRVSTIDSRETAPAAMHPQSFWENGAPLPFNDARYSGLSIGVPGTVAGWDQALDRYGSFSLARALRPATDVAREGFVIDQTFFDQTQANVPWFDDITSTKELYLDPDGTPHDVGTVFRNADLAKTYARIAKLGAKGFYRGAVADALVGAVTHPPVTSDADHTWRPGVMTAGDLKGYRAPLRPPTHVAYRGLDVWGMGPPSSGGSTVGEALNLLTGFDLSGDRTRALHLFLEASRVAFADRGAWLADPAYFDVPLRGLLSTGFADERRALINPAHAGTSPVAPGDPRPYNGSGTSDDGEQSATVTRAGTTTHITTADADGTVVSYTFTIESTGGSGIVVPGSGFIANNELTDFNFDSTTHPNRVEGGKRPRSSMSPTIVTNAGEPAMALGSPGGSTIITTVLQLLVDTVDLDRPLPDAIAAPRATQRNTTSTLAEPAFISSPEGQALVHDYGHTLSPTGEIGAATGITFFGGGVMQAAAEPVRRGGGNAQVAQP